MLRSSFRKIYLSSNFWVIAWLLAATFIPLTYPISFPTQFWIKQEINLFLWVGIFYLNMLYVIPKFLYKGKSAIFILLIICLTVIVLVTDHQIDNLFNLPALMDKIAKLTVPDVKYKYNPIADFGVLINTLAVFGVGIILAISQKIKIDRIREQDQENEKISSELSFLKAQINPHFFFNILHTIYALTDRDQLKAKDSIYRLSHMMRYVLYETKNELTTLEKEIAFIEDYIQLMRLRLSDNVQIIFDKQNNLKNMEIAPMLMLPFIENAFKHGVNDNEQSYIYVGVYQFGGTLQIEVRNSIFKEKAENLEESNGIGLNNTKRRLNLIYPNKHILKVENDARRGEFNVNLKLHLV